MLSAVLGCAPLETIELNQCGNRVYEPEAGEDCDGFTNSGYSAAPDEVSGDLFCAPPGLEHACRYHCRDDSGADRACPPGWGCGVDGVCRMATATFAEPIDLGATPARWITTADFDNDGRRDVLAAQGSLLSLYFMDDAGRPSGSHETVVSFDNPPAVADVDRDGHADVISSTVDGLAVHRGTSGRTLVPTTYATFPLGNLPTSNLVYLKIDLEPERAGDEPLVIDSGVAAFVSTTELRAVGTVPLLELYPAAVGRVVTGSLREQFVLATPSDDNLHVYVPTTSLDQGSLSIDLGAPTLIALPGVANGGPSLLHLNADPGAGVSPISCPTRDPPSAPLDDHLDVAVEVEGGFAVAFGDGQGHFHSDPCTLPPGPAPEYPDDAATVLPEVTACSSALAVAQLDADGLPDFVLGDGVWLSELSGDCESGEVFPRTTSQPWTEVALGDFNGDGFGDVIASSSGSVGIDWLAGTGSVALNPAQLPEAHVVALFEVGDYDGNGIDDLAFVQRRAEAGEDALAVMFGRQSSLPEDTRRIGSLPAIDLLGAIDMASLDPVPVADAMTDLLLARYRGEDNRVLGLIRGRADQELQAPFQLNFVGEGVKGDENLIVSRIYAPDTALVGSFELDGASQGPETGIVAVASGQAFSNPADAREAAIASVVATGGVLRNLVLSGDPVEYPLSLRDRVTLSAAPYDAERGLDTPVIVEFDDVSTPRAMVLRALDASGNPAAPWLPGPGLSIARVLPPGDLACGGEDNPCAIPFLDRLELQAVECRLDPDSESESLVILGFVLPAETHAYVIGPEALAKLRAGSASSDDVTLITAPLGELMTGIACLNVDEDGEQELAFVSVETPSLDTHVYAVSPPFDMPPKRMVELVRDPITGRGLLVGPVGLTAGDVNGDGVDDLVVPTATTMHVLTALPHRP